jgi:hypothetical protein
LNKNLIYLFLKLDYRDRDKSSKKKFIGIAVSYLFTNLMLSLNYYFFFDYLSYSILSYTVNIFLLSFIALNEFQNLFFAKTHTEILRALPISGKDLFISKFLSAFVFLFLIISAPVISQSVVFYFYDYNIYKSLIFALTDYLFSFSAIGIIIFLFMLALLKIPRKSNYMLYLLQFIFLIFVMYSSSLSARARINQRQSILEFGFVNYFPQKLFALSVDSPVYLAISAAVFLAVYILLYLFAMNRYLQISDIIFTLESKTVRKRKFAFFSNINSFIQKVFLRNNFEKASYNLIKNQFINSKTLKLRYVPLIFIPLIFCIIGVLVNMRSYLVFVPEKGVPPAPGEIIILTPSILLTIVMISRLLISNTKIADENSEDVEWIYTVLPIENKKVFLRGIQKFVNIYFIVPVFLIAAIILSIKIEPVPLLLNIIFILVFVFFINSLFLLFDNKYPFTLKSSKYNSASKIVEVFLMMFIGVAVFVVQIFIFKNVIFVLISLVIILLLTFFISKK